MMRGLLALTCLWSVACVTTKIEYEPITSVEWRSKKVDSLPIAQATNLGKFKVTYYWIVDEIDYHGQKEVPLYLENGSLLGYFPRQFVSAFKKEAVARLKDGKLISYLKRKGTVRVVTEPLGYQGYTLTTLKSVAVDTRIIPLGSKLYIPQFERLYMGNNGVHNGIFHANDIGSQVQGNHIDIFIGEKDNLKYIMSKSGRGSGQVDVYLLK
jgi:3D (Asp-Asp-Asp) domain-containing protein